MVFFPGVRRATNLQFATLPETVRKDALPTFDCTSFARVVVQRKTGVARFVVILSLPIACIPGFTGESAAPRSESLIAANPLRATPSTFVKSPPTKTVVPCIASS